MHFENMEGLESVFKIPQQEKEMFRIERTLNTVRREFGDIKSTV